MDKTTVRKYTPSDLQSCRALWAELTQRHRELYHDPTIGGDAPGLYFDKHLERAGPERLWVAEAGGEAVGLTGLIETGEDAEVEPVVVAAAHRGQGIGQALLARAVEEAKRLGVRYLSVHPVARNEEAIAFFHGAGFRALGQIELLMDLRPSPAAATWKPGPEVHGHRFDV